VHFPTGVNVGVLGRNGAGKSTLLRIISGVEPPDTGTVLRKSRVSWPIGFGGGFNSSLSGEENCRFVARIYGESPDRVVAFTREFADIGKFFEMPIKTYSQGMRARLAFGLSMAIDFEVYLVDEVTAVGDSDFQSKSRAIFEERRSRSSLIIVSHSLRTIREYCTLCAVLGGGKVQMFDSVQAARKVYRA
jgi:capsular polysaccharide transport system ATP-binding protein